MAERFNSFGEAFNYWRQKRIAENVSDIFQWNGRDYHSYTTNELKGNPERTQQIADQFNWSSNLRNKYGIDTQEVKQDPKRSEKVELQKVSNPVMHNDQVQIQQNEVSPNDKIAELRKRVFGQNSISEQNTQQKIVTNVTQPVTNITKKPKGFGQGMLDELKMAINGIFVDGINTPASMMNEGGKAVSQLLGIQNPKNVFGYVPKLDVQNDSHQTLKEVSYGLLPALLSGGTSLLQNTQRGEKLIQLLSSKGQQLKNILKGVNPEETAYLQKLAGQSADEFLGITRMQAPVSKNPLRYKNLTSKESELLSQIEQQKRINNGYDGSMDPSARKDLLDYLKGLNKTKKTTQKKVTIPDKVKKAVNSGNKTTKPVVNELERLMPRTNVHGDPDISYEQLQEIHQMLNQIPASEWH